MSAAPSSSPGTSAPARVAEPSTAAELPASHPRGLRGLCSVVFFERCAAYLLGSTAVLMLCERYGLDRVDALRGVGAYTAGTYLLTLAGGAVVERGLTSQRALSLGTALLALGYAALTLPGTRTLKGALLLLLLGHALFKPSTQTAMAALYAPGDRRLDTAQIRFYLAANAGGTVGAIAAGLLVCSHDFRALCATAAAAMLCARLALMRASPRPRESSRIPQLSEASKAGSHDPARQYPPSQRVWILAALLLSMMLYTVGFGQVEGSLFLWAQERTERRLFSLEIPAAWFVGAPAFLVVLLAPVQLRLMPWLGRRLCTGQLIAVGVATIVAAFAVLVPPALLSGGQRVSMAWLLACMTLLVIGELLIAPLSLSMLLRLVPARWVGLAVALWYVAGAMGYWLSGELGAQWVR